MSRVFFFGALLLTSLLAGCASSPNPKSALRLPPEKTDVALPPVAPIDTLTPLTLSALPPAALDDENSVYFGFGATGVDLVGQQELRTVALRLQEDPDLVVTLIGHTDNLGSRSYNLAIAEKRIEAVVKLLRSYGVAKSQIRRYALGNEKSDAACRTEPCRKKMRRVELYYPK